VDTRNTETDSERRPATRLTMTALVAHNRSVRREDQITEEKKRIERLQKAARELGFELPRETLWRGSWELESWMDKKSEFRRGKW